jgi:hypothetical protein
MSMATTSVGSVHRAWNFGQSIGVNTHIDWQGSGSSYADVAVVEASLAYLGVTHVRDGIPFSTWTLPEYEAIAATGVKFDILVTAPDIDFATDLAQINQLAAAIPGSVASVEGANEFNLNGYTYAGVSSLNNPAWAQLFGPALYAAVKADPSLAGVSVVAACMANASTADLQKEGNLDSFVDSSNWHVYYGNGDQPGVSIASAIAAAESTAPGKPVTITETGYYTAIKAMDWGGGGVTPAVQAILTVNAVLDAFKDGAQTTYMYELLDTIANPSSTDLADSFGLFYADGTPKPAATAIHDLTTILADTGANAATFQTATLNATITGLPATGNDMVFEKSNGAYDIVVWNEPTVWNETTMSEVTPTATPITVNLGATYGYVRVFDPLVGSTPIEAFSNVSAIQLSLGSDPFIIEIEPFSTPQTYSPGAAGGTIDSVSEDTVLVGTGTVTVNATGPTIAITGGAGALTYTGTAQATITGGAGAMNITLSGSGSRVTGGAGAMNVILSVSGSTVIDGSGGMTVRDLVGGNTIQGATGNYANNTMTVRTTTGDDMIIADSWINTLYLGAGNDTVVATTYSTITGSTGDDTITANQGWMTITTGTGSSLVTMNTGGVVTTNGRDTVYANAGLTLNADGPATTLIGGAGFIWFAGDGGATITAGSGGGYFNMTQITRAMITTIQGATDTILFGAAGGTLDSQGTDTVQLGGGAATITATGLSIAITGGTGALTYTGTALEATITGASGAMNVTVSAGDATITTGSGTAQIVADAWTNTLMLGSGTDTVIANGDATITGTTGNDIITIDAPWATIATGTGTSVVTVASGGIVTTNGRDTVHAQAGLPLTANGPTTNVTAGTGFMWFGGDGGSATITTGAGGGYFNLTQIGSSTVTTTAGGSDSIVLGGGAATISAAAGTASVYGAAGKMSFIEGNATSNVYAGNGVESFTLTKGQAGGALTINDFVPGSDTITLVGYQTADMTTQIVGGATQIKLSDKSVITLTNFTAAGWHPTLQA